MAARRVGKSQGRQRSLRRLLSASMSTSVTSFTFTVDQLFPIFNQIQPLQFASSLEIEIRNAIQSWGVGPLYIYLIYGSNLIKFTPPPCAIQVCADRKFDNQVQ